MERNEAIVRLGGFYCTNSRGVIVRSFRLSTRDFTEPYAFTHDQPSRVGQRPG